MTRTRDAVVLFKSGLNWAQSMLAAYGTKLGIDYETALQIGNAFGGGMGKTGETCGAISGALMIIGLKYGARDEGDRTAKDKTYEQAEAFLKEFQTRNGSLICRELIGFQISGNIGPEKNAVIARRCPAFVSDAAEIVENILEAEMQRSRGRKKRAHSG